MKKEAKVEAKKIVAKHTRIERTEEHRLSIPRGELVAALRTRGFVIPDEADITIDASGCYCDNIPQLTDASPLLVEWNLRTVEDKEE